jgi:hypothetical protein
MCPQIGKKYNFSAEYSEKEKIIFISVFELDGKSMAYVKTLLQHHHFPIK